MKMKKINIVRLLAICMMATAFASCTRNEMPTRQSNSKTKIDHLLIKEVFYAGHYWVRDVRPWGMKNTNYMYNDDQYLIIYNPTDEVKYLDGLALCINAIDPTKSIKFAPKDDFVNRYYGITSLAYFPGSGKEHPINPRQTIVVVKYAIDHKAQFEHELEGEDLSMYKGLDAFLDLTKADFEWTNINYDRSHRNNPKVPDLVPIMTGKDQSGNIVPDFEFRELTEHGGIALIKLPWTPDDFAKNYQDEKGKKGYLHYINVTGSLFGDFEAIEIPFKNVIDCITICPRSQFQMRPSKLDKGYNAITDDALILTKQSEYPTYSGLALTRRWDGKKFIDDNNTTSDFQVKVASLSRKDNNGNIIK